jgi:hypothetical protein
MSKDMAGRKVNVTKNYRLFERSADNRVLCPKKHKKLERSLKAYGFLSCFPVVCHRNGDKHLIVKDGQHRLAIAETLGLPVYWIEETVDFDVAVVNSTAKVWVTRDYAEKYAASGVKAYIEGLEFADNHKLPVGIAFAILGGTTTYSNVQSDFESGSFKIKDRKWADAIAGIYSPLTTLSPACRNAQLLTACMAVCRVPDFDAKRLLKNADRCRDRLVSYSTREAYLDMLEGIYNHHCAKLLGLKAEATMAMRDRSAAVASKKKKESKAVVSEGAAA